jgi:antitoxin component of RelBE/YafQ-DinJ toxin-antitoxin module
MEETKTADKQLNVTVTEDLHLRLKRAAVDARIPVKVIVAAAIERALQSSTDDAPPNHSAA